MEEILASIRRIIEDSDGGRPDNAAVAAPPAVDEADTDLATFRAELAREAESVAPAPTPIAADLTMPEIDVPSRSPRLSFDAGRRPEPAARLPEIDAAARHAQPSADSHSAFATVEPIEPELPAATETVSTEARASRTGILSEAASRQVAASFGELSDAFSASRRSFDEIAEDMLRPMLQDWLDNNLPTLVERLVREEIERVARGGSR